MEEFSFWKRFRKNKLALAGLYFILFCLFLSLFGYWLVPDNTSNSNVQNLSIAASKPFFKVKVLLIRNNEPSGGNNFVRLALFGKKAIYKEVPVKNYKVDGNYIVIQEYTKPGDTTTLLRRYHLLDVAFALPYNMKLPADDIQEFQLNDLDGKKIRITRSELTALVLKNNLITRTYFLGTDRFGRDMVSRLIIGTRVSLSVGFISVVISLIIGLSLGIIAGFYRGTADKIIMWLINVVWSVPTLLMVLAISLVLGKGFWQVFVAVGLTMWVEVARVARGQVLSVREKEYVEAARALGFKDIRILFRHILPNILSPVIIISASNFASAILIESGLSFLGIGVQPPVPSWGSIMKDHYGYIILDQAYLAFMPGLAIMLLVLAFTLVGNGLRDTLDTRLL